MPRDGEVLLSLARLTDARRRRPPRAPRSTRAPGSRSPRCRRTHAPPGLDAGVDFAARDSATVGGLVATDAGGIRALRHGTVRARVAGPGGGARRRLGRRPHERAAEGQRRLRPAGAAGRQRGHARRRHRACAGGSSPPLGPRVAALCRRGLARRGRAALAPAARSARSSTPPSSCSTTAWRSCSTTSGSRRRCPPAAPPTCWSSARGRRPARRARRAPAWATTRWSPTTPPGRERLWRVREHHTEAIAAAGVPHKLDVGVPLDRLGAFADERARRGRARGARGPGVPVRPPRRRQRPRQRARPRPERRGGRRGGAASSPRGWAARSAPSTASAWPRRAS